jgi:hypothetical protein
VKSGDEVARDLGDVGFSVIGNVLEAAECASFVARYDDDALFRKTVTMTRHGFGRGEYRYFADPLPHDLRTLRASLYATLAPIANAWWEALRMPERFPLAHAEFLEQAHAAGQRLPTPLLLRYGRGDFNCLHQDLYGAVWFPLQVAVLLDEPGRDFEGGEFVLVEQRPRQQSRPIVVPLRRGEGVVFPCNVAPRRGARGVHRAKMRHGVSEIRAGRRHALGIIFHDATK